MGAHFSNWAQMAADKSAQAFASGDAEPLDEEDEDEVLELEELLPDELEDEPDDELLDADVELDELDDVDVVVVVSSPQAPALIAKMPKKESEIPKAKFPNFITHAS